MGKTLSKMQLKLEKHLDSILVCSHWEHYSTTRHGLAWDGKAFLSGLLGNREASGGGDVSSSPAWEGSIFVSPVPTMRCKGGTAVAHSFRVAELPSRSNSTVA